MEASEAGDSIVVDGRTVSFSQHTDPVAVPWGGAEIVLECSGAFLTKEKLQPFLDAGVVQDSKFGISAAVAIAN